AEGLDVPSHLAPLRRRPVFVNLWTTYFDGRWTKKAGVEKLKELALEMLHVSNAEFGFLTTLTDLDAKNYLVTQEGACRCMSYEGKDPEYGIPRLYWLNTFGPRLV